MLIAILVLQIVTVGALAASLTMGSRLSSRQRRRLELAEMAVNYAEMMGGDGKNKLSHAVSAFGKLDLADNGKRDFSDAEARIAIEAFLANK